MPHILNPTTINLSLWTGIPSPGWLDWGCSDSSIQHLPEDVFRLGVALLPLGSAGGPVGWSHVAGHQKPSPRLHLGFSFGQGFSCYWSLFAEANSGHPNHTTASPLGSLHPHPPQLGTSNPSNSFSKFHSAMSQQAEGHTFASRIAFRTPSSVRVSWGQLLRSSLHCGGINLYIWNGGDPGLPFEMERHGGFQAGTQFTVDWGVPCRC